MKRLTFGCGDKIYIKIKNRLENGIVCRDVDTVDEKRKVRVIMESGKVTEIIAGNITKR